MTESAYLPSDGNLKIRGFLNYNPIEFKHNKDEADKRIEASVISHNFGFGFIYLQAADGHPERVEVFINSAVDAVNWTRIYSGPVRDLATAPGRHKLMKEIAIQELTGKDYEDILNV